MYRFCWPYCFRIVHFGLTLGVSPLQIAFCTTLQKYQTHQNTKDEGNDLFSLMNNALTVPYMYLHGQKQSVITWALRDTWDMQHGAAKWHLRHATWRPLSFGVSVLPLSMYLWVSGLYRLRGRTFDGIGFSPDKTLLWISAVSASQSLTAITKWN